MTLVRLDNIAIIVADLDAAIAFFRAHDIGYRIRRLRLIARRGGRVTSA